MNLFAFLLFAIGGLVIASGIVLGIMAGAIGNADTFNFPIAFPYIFGGAFSGLTIMAFAEIINLLDKGNKIAEENKQGK